ncbi:Sec-independent protein translocase protein TatB [Devosia sp. A449]
MLGLGWTEMLVIGVVALIVIGPKDLPVVMNRVGKIVGQIRRMGNDFQREINKTTGMDEVRNLRNSITAPLKKTSDEIRKEFNAMTPTGPKPSGVIKPTDPKAESVVDEIKAAAGMTPPKTADQVAAESGFKSAATTPKAPVAAPAKKVVAKKAPVKAKAAPTRPVITTELAPLESPAPADKPVKKPAAKKTATAKPAAAAKPAKAVEAEPAVAKPAPKKRAAAKPKAAPVEAAKAGDV